MENFREKLAVVKKKAKFQGKRWFILSYLLMLIVFFGGCGLLLSFFPFVIGTAPIGAFILGYFGNLIMAIFIIFILIGFILGRVLKKRSLYFAKGFTYGSITIIVLCLLFFLSM